MSAFKSTPTRSSWHLCCGRLLAIGLVLAVGLLGLHAALHWHGPDYDNCQACHSGRVAIFQPAVQLALQPPLPVARFALPATVFFDLEPVCTHRTPRAPPVQPVH